MRTTIVTYHAESGWATPLPDGLDAERTWVLVFGAPSFADESAPFDELRRRFPRSHVMGCSTSGEIQGAKVLDRTVVVAIVCFERTGVRHALAPIQTASESRAAGESLARQLADPDLRSVFILSDGRLVNGSELVAGVNGILPRSVVVTGGLAGDGDRFQRTWVLVDGVPASGHVSAVGLYGDRICVGHGSRGGWDIFGPERVITRSEGNVLYELDGRPALSLYKEYLGNLVSGLPSTALLFPLAIRTPGADDQRVRTILDIDEQAQAMVFAGDVPMAANAQLMRANFDRLVQGASDAAAMTSASADTGSVLSIAVSCVGRRLVLRQRIEEELEAVLEVLPQGTQQVGFYSYGELSPIADGACELHNQTMTLTTLHER